MSSLPLPDDGWLPNHRWIGYPYICKTNNFSKPFPGRIDLFKGEFGTITGVSTKEIWVQVTVKDAQKHGTVPRFIVEVGTEVKVGDRQLDIIMNHSIPSEGERDHCWTQETLQDRTVYQRFTLHAFKTGDVIEKDGVMTKKGGVRLIVDVMGVFGFGPVTLSSTGNPDTLGLGDGTPIAMAIEIMHERMHKFPFHPLPSVGPWSDWDEALRLAITVKWKNESTGKHWRRYLQRQCVFNPVPNVPMSLAGYAQSMALTRYLCQETIGNPPYWHENYGTARIIDVQWDHIRQRNVLTKSINTNTVVPMPRLKRGPQLAQKLRESGLKNVNTFLWPDYLPADTTRQVLRPKDTCDACCLGLLSSDAISHWMKVNGYGAGNCSQVGDGKRGIYSHCECCKAKGLPCSFTELKDMSDDSVAYRALMFPPYHNNAVFEIPVS